MQAPTDLRYIHQAAIYHSDEEFNAIVLPFVYEALEADEPVILAMPDQPTALIRRALGPQAERLHVLDDAALYRRPTSALATARDLLPQMTPDTGRIRMLGELPPQTATTWGWWAQYESASNHAYTDLPLWQLCTYDARSRPAEVLDDVYRTHPCLAGADGEHQRSASFADHAALLARAGPIDALEAATPFADLTDPSLQRARHAARDAGRFSGCTQEQVTTFIIAVNEAVTNASCHGNGPVRLRVWWAEDRLVAAVTDGGLGPADPLAGLVPANGSATGGLGLWLAHETCDHVTFSTAGEGFTVRLVVGDLAAA